MVLLNFVSFGIWFLTMMSMVVAKKNDGLSMKQHQGLNATYETSGNLTDVQVIQNISRIVGSSFKMSCYADTYADIRYILWKNASSGEHLMSYIASKPGELKFSIPESSKLKERIYYPNWQSFSIQNPPFVEILKVETRDSGLYQCRILYRSLHDVVLGKILRLQVIEPTTRMTVKEAVLKTSANSIGSGNHLDSIHSQSKDAWVTLSSDHYIEGQNLTLICIAFDGHPLPKLIWRGMGGVIDNSSEVVDGYSVKNELTLARLGRQHFFSVFTCEASHSDADDSSSIFATLSRHVKLNIYLSPKSIELNIPIEMKAGENYILSCGTRGAYPKVRILIILDSEDKWFKIQESYPDKKQSYFMTFRPVPGDDRRTIICRVDNPYLTGMGFQTVETKSQIRVLSPPVVYITLASKNVSKFFLGDSLLLECRIQCVPAPEKIEWFINERSADSENGKNVVIMGSTLLISSLTNFLASNYTCQATNSLGVGTSNVFSVNLKETLKNSKPSDAKDIFYLNETFKAVDETRDSPYSPEEYDEMQANHNNSKNNRNPGSWNGRINTMLIVIASVAVVANIIVAVFVVYLLKKRRRRLQKTESPQKCGTTTLPGKQSITFSPASGGPTGPSAVDVYSTCSSTATAAFYATRPLPPIPPITSRTSRGSSGAAAVGPMVTEM